MPDNRATNLHESDGPAACSHPWTYPPGAVACAHDNRPLLGLVTFMTSKTNLDTSRLVPLQPSQSMLPPIQRHVRPCQTVHGVYHSGR